MKPEDKELLLKDLCARLPYGFTIHRPSDNANLKIKDIDDFAHFLEYSDGEEFKPYLRPMSSMTEEENEIATNISNKGKGFEEDEDGWIRCDSIHTKWGVWPDGCAKLLDYLNSIHIDYRCLIPMGLALEAPEGMYEN